MVHSLLLISITPEGTETLYYLNRTLEGIKELYHLNRTLRKYLITLPFKQNAEKVPETKKEGRRRTSQYVEALLMKYMMPYTSSEATSKCS